MSTLLQALQKGQTKTRTENGAKTFSTSLDANLDLFFMAGAFRNRSSNEVIALIGKAYAENPTTALQILAYARDCRGGMGERRFFREGIKHLASIGADFNVSLIPVVGRWDDLFALLDTSKRNEVLDLITQTLVSDGEEKNLLAKWIPRKGPINKVLRDHIGFSQKQFRHMIVELTKVVETQMCNKEWGAIKYSAVPSVANVKYNTAFLRNDETRRRDFLGKAVKGEVKINSSVAFPHDVLYRTGVRGDWQTATAMWNQLPNYLEGSDVRFLPMCDVSGSMSGTPMEISISLGMYLSERNISVFKDAFLTFSETPSLQYLRGDLRSRYEQLRRANWGMNTNLTAAFDLILGTAMQNKVSADNMPTHLLIISDMEFDHCTDLSGRSKTAFKMVKDRYKQAGYEMPNIVFWNVNSRSNNVPVRFNADGVGLVSGASPAVIKAVLGGEINPIAILNRAIDQDKYREFAKA